LQQNRIKNLDLLVTGDGTKDNLKKVIVPERPEAHGRNDPLVL
jgi:hypothetical protein